MKIYKIVEDDENCVQSSKKNSSMLANDVAKIAITTVAPVPTAALALYKSLSTQAVSLPISQAWLYQNATNADWKLKALYVEHPRRKQVLIPFKEYNDYIKREMVADIADFIMDHVPAKEVVIGIVSSRNVGADAVVAVCDVNANANLSCKIERKYIVRYEGAASSNPKYEYTWIDQFPDVKSAVEHQVKHFEVINEAAVELNAEFSVPEKVRSAFKKEKKLQLYISFYCE